MDTDTLPQQSGGFRAYGLLLQIQDMLHTSADVDELVGLEGEAPGGVGLAVFNGFVKQEAVFPGIAGVAGLEEAPVCNDGIVDAHVLAGIDDFQFIAFCEADLCGGNHVVLRGTGDPVNAGRKSMGAVGFDGDVSAAGMEGRNKFICQEKGGFSAGDDSEAGGICRDGRDDFLCRHETAFLMGGIAERTAEIAAGKAHEDGGSAGMVAFSLKGIKYFVDFVLLHNGPETAWTLQGGIFKAVLYIHGDIALGLLEQDFVAVGHPVANPSGKILSGCIEIHHFINITVVQHSGHQLLYMCEVCHHPIAVELLRAAEHRDNGIVAVQTGAFALIIKGKAVCKGYFQAFRYIIHSFVSCKNSRKLIQNIPMAQNVTYP